ncbi:MAG: hypothetical protein ACE366_13110 [Bradymonadia bacterium]
MSRSASRPLLVIVHPNPQAQVSLRTTLEAGGHLMVAVASDGVDAVERVIRNQPPVAALLFDWEYFDLNAPKFLPRLVRARVPQKPFLLTLHHDWQLNDLHRAEQLGVQGLLWAPLRMPALVKELVSLKKTGRSSSFQSTRQAISERRSLNKGALARAGVKQDNGWSNRMAALAANARSRSGGANREEQIESLLSKMDNTLGRPVSVKLAEAVVLNLKGDAYALQEFLTTHAVDRRAVQRLSEVVQKVGGQSAKAQAKGRTGPSAISLLLATDVMERVKARAEGRIVSGAFKDVRQAAAGYLTDSSDAADLAMFMGEWLEIDASVFSRMQRKRARRMAERMLSESNERKAKEYARLFALASLLNARNNPQHMAEQERDALVGLASVLSSARSSGEDGLQRLMEMSEGVRSGEYDDLGLNPGEMPDFAEFNDLFAEMATEMDDGDDDFAALQRDLAALGAAMGHPAEEAKAVEEIADDPRAALVAALAQELNLGQALISEVAPDDLAEHLPPCKMPDWQAPPERLRVVRTMARILTDTTKSEGHDELLRAFHHRYEDEFLMIRALLVCIEGTRSPAAVKMVRDHLDLCHGTPTARDIKGYIARGALGQAMLMVAELPSSEKQTAQLVNLVAMSLRNAGQLSESEWLYRKGLRQAPSRISLLYNYARLKMDQGETQVAGQLLKRALQIDPQHEPSVELLENIRLQMAAKRRRSGKRPDRADERRRA